MSKVTEIETIQEIYAFMGEMRAERDSRDQQLQNLRDELSKTNKQVEGLLSKVGRWEAKFGTIMFIGSCLWAAFMAFKGDILNFIKG